MKKLLLITIILLLQSFPSFGEWEEIDSNEDGVYFIEVDTIRKKGDLVYFNTLTDNFEPDASIYNSLSSTMRRVINCKTKQAKRLRSVNYLNSMGRGKIVLEMSYEWEKMSKYGEFGNYRLYHKFLC